MTITEISFKDLKNTYEPEAQFLICANVKNNFVWFDNYQSCPALTPGNVAEFKAGLLSKEQFQQKFKRQLKTPVCKELIKYLNTLDKVFLVSDTGLLLDTIESL
jgi:hypothetical protein